MTTAGQASALALALWSAGCANSQPTTRAVAESVASPNHAPPTPESRMQRILLRVLQREDWERATTPCLSHQTFDEMRVTVRLDHLHPDRWLIALNPRMPEMIASPALAASIRACAVAALRSPLEHLSITVDWALRCSELSEASHTALVSRPFVALFRRVDGRLQVVDVQLPAVP